MFLHFLLFLRLKKEGSVSEDEHWLGSQGKAPLFSSPLIDDWTRGWAWSPWAAPLGEGKRRFYFLGDAYLYF